MSFEHSVCCVFYGVYFDFVVVTFKGLFSNGIQPMHEELAFVASLFWRFFTVQKIGYPGCMFKGLFELGSKHPVFKKKSMLWSDSVFTD